jgi:hypothetical protein
MQITFYVESIPNQRSRCNVDDADSSWFVKYSQNTWGSSQSKRTGNPELKAQRIHAARLSGKVKNLRNQSPANMDAFRTSNARGVTDPEDGNQKSRISVTEHYDILLHGIDTTETTRHLTERYLFLRN